jgi:hypothetical protein
VTKPEMRSIVCGSVLLLVLGLLLASCATLREVKPDPLSGVAGVWKEHWVDEEGDLGYNDLYYFSVTDGSFLISCPEYPAFVFSEIRFDGRHLGFTLTNVDDPNDFYIMEYELELSDDGREFIGYTHTNKDVTAQIRLEKMERTARRNNE